MKFGVKALDFHPSGEFKSVVVDAASEGALVVVFIFNLAENFFHNIFESYQSGSTAKLVDHNSKSLFLGHESAHHLVGEHSLGGVEHRFEALSPVGVGVEEFKHMDVAQHIVDIIVVDHDFR